MYWKSSCNQTCEAILQLVGFTGLQDGSMFMSEEDVKAHIAAQRKKLQKQVVYFGVGCAIIKAAAVLAEKQGY